MSIIFRMDRIVWYVSNFLESQFSFGVRLVELGTAFEGFDFMELRFYS